MWRVVHGLQPGSCATDFRVPHRPPYLRLAAEIFAQSSYRGTVARAHPKEPGGIIEPVGLGCDIILVSDVTGFKCM